MTEDYTKAIEDLVGTKLPQNPQSYYRAETSPRYATDAHVKYQSSDDKLFGDDGPNVAYEKEQPWHRVAILLKAQGISNIEIGRTVGKTPVCVGQVLRQPWARLRLIKEQQACGRKGIELVLEGAALDSVNTLIDLRDSPTVPPNVKATCAMDLLNRVLGKPIQRTESDVKITNVPNDLAELDRELEKVNADLNRLNVKSN